MLHLGWRKMKDRCQQKSALCDKALGYASLVLRVASIGFAATLSRWTVSPTEIVTVGVPLVFLQLVLRKMGGHYLPDHHETHHH
jgi:protein-S-isoprenylcysteine O-methyltransferase Ste14